MKKIEISCTERKVIFEICKNLNEEGYCSLKNEALSDFTDLTKTGVQFYLNELQQKGFIIILFDDKKIKRRIYLTMACTRILLDTVMPQSNTCEEAPKDKLDEFDEYLRANFMEEDEITIGEVEKLIEEFQQD